MTQGNGRPLASSGTLPRSILSEDLVEVGRRSSIAKVTARRQFQQQRQQRRERAHGGDSEDAGPALDPAPHAMQIEGSLSRACRRRASACVMFLGTGLRATAPSNAFGPAPPPAPPAALVCKPLWPPRLWRRSGRLWRPRPRLHTHWSDSSQGEDR